MLSVIPQILLLFHFSLIFSMCFIGVTFVFKTRDKLIFRFVSMLVPLFLYLFILVMYHLLGLEINKAINGFEQEMSLLAIVTVLIAEIFILRNTSRFTLLLTSETENHWAHVLIDVLSALIGVVLLWFIIGRFNTDWQIGLQFVLGDLFSYMSLVLTTSGIAALFFVKQKEKRSKLISLSAAFLLLPLFLFIDSLLPENMEYRIIHFSYTIFTTAMFYTIMRHYIQTYEPKVSVLKSHLKRFYEKYNISEREADVISLMLEKQTNAGIADKLCISKHTVKTHIQNIYKKTDIRTRQQLASLIYES